MLHFKCCSNYAINEAWSYFEPCISIFLLDKVIQAYKWKYKAFAFKVFCEIAKKGNMQDNNNTPLSKRGKVTTETESESLQRLQCAAPLYKAACLFGKVYPCC